ncbi:hypothetical protein DEO72_LG7g1109 [Vigna unguiculata]|uniref:Uncharacterized protein n=1 Tax=Vigna unguiculata TaxID=3917 RepID=A0A4D6MGA5_VIGUN|nr:hypothetical protein DEO72_LG7g1109 [Vigna unguiculata]
MAKGDFAKARKDLEAKETFGCKEESLGCFRVGFSVWGAVIHKSANDVEGPPGNRS